MIKQSNIPISGLYRYECHLEKIINQAQQSLHLKRTTSASFNQTQKVASHDHPILQKNKSKVEPHSRQAIRMNNISHPNHRKMPSSISKPKEKSASTNSRKSAKQKCKSAFIQSPNHKVNANKSATSDEKSIRAGSVSVDIKTKEDELNEKIDSYEELISLMKCKYLLLKVCDLM